MCASVIVHRKNLSKEIEFDIYMKWSHRKKRLILVLFILLENVAQKKTLYRSQNCQNISKNCMLCMHGRVYTILVQ